MSASGHSAGPAGFRFVTSSPGGLPVLTTLLRGRPGTFPVPVLVVSHRPHREHDALARVLQKQACLPARAGDPGVTVIPGGTSATIGGRQLALAAAARPGCFPGLLAASGGGDGDAAAS
jgi:chemotaxis response regulator CheB